MGELKGGALLLKGREVCSLLVMPYQNRLSGEEASAALGGGIDGAIGEDFCAVDDDRLDSLGELVGVVISG